jgi:hypothetical protein
VEVEDSLRSPSHLQAVVEARATPDKELLERIAYARERWPSLFAKTKLTDEELLSELRRF